MLEVTLDIFSGLENPSWVLSDEEEKELVDRIEANRGMMVPVSADTGGLGYRGYIVSTLSEDDGAATKAGLPSLFKVGGANDLDQAAALWLLDTSQKVDSTIDDQVRSYAQGLIVSPAPPEQPVEIPVEDTSLKLPAEPTPGFVTLDPPVIQPLAVCTLFLTTDVDFTFWNASSFVLRNNCYNYASNYRTNTFAQPGRRSGRMYSRINCSEVGSAAVRDGYTAGCGNPLTLATALVIAPGPGFVDYHWYRLCVRNHWCHKPGGTAARNYDNSGRWITDPRFCNRGPYTIFCGFYYARNPANVR